MINYERMWNQLKQDISQQNQLSDNVIINKLEKRIKDIEEAEELASETFLKRLF